jgi:hypothetical protein
MGGVCTVLDRTTPSPGHIISHHALTRARSHRLGTRVGRGEGGQIARAGSGRGGRRGDDARRTGPAWTAGREMAAAGRACCGPAALYGITDKAFEIRPSRFNHIECIYIYN